MRSPAFLAAFALVGGAGAQSFVTSARTTSNSTRLLDSSLTSMFNTSPFTGAGGVNVAVGDLNGDFMPDYVVGAASGGPRVVVFDGSNRRPLYDFTAFSSFSGGVNVATGDVNNDGTDDILVGGEGLNCPVNVYNGKTLGLLHSFLAYPAFSGGVRVAAGDVNGDGAADVIIAPGTGAGPRVQVFNGLTGGTLLDFFAYDPGFTGGVFVAAGDVNGDGIDDVVTGAGPGGGPHVKVFSGTNASSLASFLAFDPAFTGGVFVAAGDVNGDGKADLVASQSSMGGVARVFETPSLNLSNTFSPEGTSFMGGLAVAAYDRPSTFDFGFYLNKDTVAGQNSVLASVFTNLPVMAATTFTTFDNTSLVVTPAAALVASGASFKNFQLTTTAINSTINVTISAKLGSKTLVRPLTLAPLIPTSISFNPNPVKGGNTTQARVVINGVAGPGGRTISIVENSAFVTSPTSVTVPPGGTDVFFAVTTSAVSSNQSVPFKAIVSAGQCTGSLRLTP